MLIFKNIKNFAIVMSLIFIVSNCYAQKLTVENKTKNYDVAITDLVVTFANAQEVRQNPSSLKRIAPGQSGVLDYAKTLVWLGWDGGPVHTATLSVWPKDTAESAFNRNTKSTKVNLDNWSNTWKMSDQTSLNLRVSKIDRQSYSGYIYYNYVLVVEEINTSSKVDPSELQYINFKDNKVKVQNKSFFPIKAMVNKTLIEIPSRQESDVQIKDDASTFEIKVIDPNVESQNNVVVLGTVDKNLQDVKKFETKTVQSRTKTAESYTFEGNITPYYIIDYENPKNSKVEYRIEIQGVKTEAPKMSGVNESQIDYKDNTLIFRNESDFPLNITLSNNQKITLQPKQKGNLTLSGGEWISFSVKLADGKDAAVFEEKVISKKLKPSASFDRQIPGSPELVQVKVEPFLVEKERSKYDVNYDIFINVKK